MPSFCGVSAIKLSSVLSVQELKDKLIFTKIEIFHLWHIA